MKVKLTSLALLLLAGTSIHAATIISQWTFDTSPPADRVNSGSSPTVAADEGYGEASGFHGSSNTDWRTPAGNGSSDSFSANNWAVGDYWQFEISTLGFEDIDLSWDQTRSQSGPALFDLTYSLDGLNFAVLRDDFQVSEVSWSASGNRKPASLIPLVSGVSALNDQNNVYFRIIAASGATDPDGTGRIDNFIVSGTKIDRTPISTPDTGSLFLLLSLAFGGFVCAYRRGVVN